MLKQYILTLKEFNRLLYYVNNELYTNENRNY
jgi:hypothetical protein